MEGGDVTLPHLERGRFSSFVRVKDGFVLSVDDARNVAAAAVVRIDDAGHELWRIGCPPPETLHGFVYEMRREDGFAVRPHRPWKAESWVANVHRALFVSGDRVLACFSEFPRSGIGIAYLIDLTSGAIEATTTPAPYGNTVPGKTPGTFFLGVQGYGAVETRLIQRDGTVQQTWPAQGIAIVDDAVRIIELVPSRSHFSVLNDDGSVSRGAQLPGYQTSPALLAHDGSVLFWRDDALMHVTPDGQHIERLLEVDGDERTYAPAFVWTGGGRASLVLATTAQRNGKWTSLSRLFTFEFS